MPPRKPKHIKMEPLEVHKPPPVVDNPPPRTRKGMVTVGELADALRAATNRKSRRGDGPHPGARKPR